MKRILIPLFVCALFACSKKDNENPPPSQPLAVNEVTAYLDAVDSLSEFAIALKKTNITAADAAVGLTVFAPGNEAIGSYDAGARTMGKDLPDSIVKDHIVKGLFKAADLTDGKILTTLSGKQLKVKVISGDIYVNGVKITIEDGDAGTQIVHTIAEMLSASPGEANITVFDATQWSTDNRNGLPAAGATVNLYTSTEAYFDGTPDYTTTTDASGVAHFTGIPAGNYYAVVTKGSLSNTWPNALKLSLANTDSLFQSETELANAPHMYSAVPGDFRFVDINGDGIINGDDKTAAPYRIIVINDGALTTTKVLIGFEENHALKPYKTADEATTALTAIAKEIGLQQKFLVMLDGIMSDDANCDNLPNWCAYDQFSFTASDNTIYSIWNSEYASIKKLNRVIYSLPFMTGDTTVVAAQARGLRAYTYLQLATYFGEVPVTTDLLMSANISRSSLNDTYQFIKNELAIALATLPATAPDAPFRHLTSVAAKALLARIAIANSDFTTAKSYANNVIQSGHSLSADTSLIFTDVYASEILWDLSYNFPTGFYGYFYGRSFCPVVRLSEMYLISAEANIAMSDLSSAAQSINTIRNRDELSILSFANPDEARAGLMSTRKAEFNSEGYRFVDLVRWGQAAQTLGNKGYQSHHSKLPIPANILDQYPNITQNVGY